MRKLMVFLGTALLALPVYAESTANDTGWFIGGQMGVSSVKADSTNANASYRVSQRDEVGHLGAYGGYHFTPWFGLETGWLITGDLGGSYEYYDDARFFAMSLTPKLSVRVSPIFSLYAKAGVAVLAYNEDYYDDYYYYDDDYDRSWSNTVGTIGIGGQFDVTPNVKVRLGYDYYAGTLRINQKRRWQNERRESIDARYQPVSLGVHYQF